MTSLWSPADLWHSAAAPDYSAVDPVGRNIVTITPEAPAGSSPADHALTLLAEAAICTPRTPLASCRSPSLGGAPPMQSVRAV